jgi:putative membrane protein
MYWNDHTGAWGWFAMSLAALIVWGLIAAIAVLVVRTAEHDGPAGREAPAAGESRAKGAAALLAERYARGEIDDDEYKRRLAVLHSHGRGPR